jgi:Tfp pilus assembly protein PilF
VKLGYLLLQRDPVAAIAEFKRVLALAPARAHCDLALAFEVAGDARQAADEYNETLKSQPQFAEAKQGYERMQGKMR